MNRSLGHKALDWAVGTEASTRSAALIRMGLVLVLWARWARPLAWFRVDDWLTFGLSATFFFASTAMFFGIATRWSSAITAGVSAALFYYLGLYRGDEYWIHHHTMLLVYSLVLIALVPSGRSFSFDRWWAVRRSRQTGAPLPPERGNIFGLRLIAILLATIYFWAGYDKLIPAFMSGERMQHHFCQYYFGTDMPQTWWFDLGSMLLSWATVILEFVLAIAVLRPKWFRWLVLPGMLLHAAFYILLPVSTYSINMWCLYLACFDPDAFHRFVDGLLGVGHSAPSTEEH